MLKPVLACVTLFIMSAQVSAQPQVDLELSQQVDADCQGLNLSTANEVEPGQCIRYELRISNRGTSVAQSIDLNLPVPTNTVIASSLASASGEALSTQLQQSNGKSALQARLERLEAQQSLVLHYRVKVL